MGCSKNSAKKEVYSNTSLPQETREISNKWQGKHENSKSMGCSKSNSQREVYSNTTLPQETRKTLNRQPNFTPKATGKRRTKKNLVEGKKS